MTRRDKFMTMLWGAILLIASAMIAVDMTAIYSSYFGEDYTHCDAVHLAESWMHRDVTTRAELHDEIASMLIANKCDGITPTKLQKILLDMEKLL